MLRGSHKRNLKIIKSFLLEWNSYFIIRILIWLWLTVKSFITLVKPSFFHFYYSQVVILFSTDTVIDFFVNLCMEYLILAGTLPVGAYIITCALLYLSVPLIVYCVFIICTSSHYSLPLISPQPLYLIIFYTLHLLSFSGLISALVHFS